jgi:hypothetical protein
LVKGKVELGYLGSGAYENITINFTYDSDSGDCDYAGSSPVDWQYLLQQYQYNSAY